MCKCGDVLRRVKLDEDGHGFLAIYDSKEVACEYARNYEKTLACNPAMRGWHVTVKHAHCPHGGGWAVYMVPESQEASSVP